MTVPRLSRRKRCCCGELIVNGASSIAALVCSASTETLVEVVKVLLQVLPNGAAEKECNRRLPLHVTESMNMFGKFQHTGMEVQVRCKSNTKCKLFRTSHMLANSCLGSLCKLTRWRLAQSFKPLTVANVQRFHSAERTLIRVSTGVATRIRMEWKGND